MKPFIARIPAGEDVYVAASACLTPMNVLLLQRGAGRPHPYGMVIFMNSPTTQTDYPHFPPL
ncbi:MAG: hypothetical protein WCI01_01480 [Chlorobiaceae bacterium]